MAGMVTTGAAPVCSFKPRHGVLEWIGSDPDRLRLARSAALPNNPAWHEAPPQRPGLRHVQIRHCVASLPHAARYALAGALRALFAGDLIDAAVVVAAAARATRFGFSAGAGVGVAALRPSPIDFANAERVAA